MLAMLGWSSGTEQEIFSLQELIEKFSLERVHKGGAKFDFEKAKWFNHEWIKRCTIDDVRLTIIKLLEDNNIKVENEQKLETVFNLVKDRCTFINDFVQQAGYFFKTPETIDTAALKPKWDEKKVAFFRALIASYESNFVNDAAILETNFKALAEAHQIKVGEVMMPLRVMLVGGKFGPAVFDIATIIDKEETIKRIENGLQFLA
jgi:glutamyl-tRNA synthetase